MSEMVEVRKALQEIRDLAVATRTDVTWIKDGMEKGAERMDGHDEQLRGLQSSINHHRGQASVLGAIAGSVFAGVIAFFTRMHT